VQQALKEAGVGPADIGLIAYTKVGPLPGCLFCSRITLHVLFA
jgi:tRNA A37 threonylcarbamoyltransferase TsaD